MPVKKLTVAPGDIFVPKRLMKEQKTHSFYVFDPETDDLRRGSRSLTPQAFLGPLDDVFLAIRKWTDPLLNDQIYWIFHSTKTNQFAAVRAHTIFLYYAKIEKSDS